MFSWLVGTHKNNVVTCTSTALDLFHTTDIHMHQIIVITIETSVPERTVTLDRPRGAVRWCLIPGRKSLELDLFWCP